MSVHESHEHTFNVFLLFSQLLFELPLCFLPVCTELPLDGSHTISRYVNSFLIFCPLGLCSEIFLDLSFFNYPPVAVVLLLSPYIVLLLVFKFNVHRCFPYMHVCAPLVCLVAVEARIGQWTPLELSNIWLWATMWVLGIKLSSSGRAASVLHR